MNKLTALELRRTSLGPYRMAVLLCGVSMLAFQYLMAAIPHMEPGEPDAALFSSYPFVNGMTSLVSMAAFTIWGAVLASRIIVEEYSGQRAILLLTYPVSRKKVLGTKLKLVFFCTVSAMFLSGAVIQAVFYLTERLFPLCSAQLTPTAALRSLVFLLCCSLLAGLLAMLSLWIGFRKRSVPVTIVSSVILACLVCQAAGAALSFLPLMGIMLGITAILAAFSAESLCKQAETLEV